MIKNIGCHFRGILPLIYDDTITYYEQLCKFAEKLNELIDTLNNFNVDIENMVDSKIEELKKYVDDENNEQDEINTQKFEAVYDYINSKIDELYVYINNGDTILKNYLDSEISKLKKWVEDAVIGNILIYDPTTGYNNPLDVVINHVYDALRYYGITCYDYDSAKWSAQRYDDTHITALKFDTLSKQIIGKIYEWYVFDYVTGTYDTVQRVLYRLFQTVRPNAITTNTYDARALTVDSYDVLDLTAFEFDNDGSNQIPS